MLGYDERIIFYIPRKSSTNTATTPLPVETSPAESTIKEQLDSLSEDQLALAQYSRIKPTELAQVIVTSQQVHEQALQRTARLLRLIDRILAKYHPEVSCSALFSFNNKSYKVRLKKQHGREQLEYFTDDLIEELLEAGKAEGLRTLEGIIAGAVAKLH